MIWAYNEDRKEMTALTNFEPERKRKSHPRKKTYEGFKEGMWKRVLWKGDSRIEQYGINL